MENGEPVDGDEPGEEGRPVWTPENVAGALEHVIRHGVMMIRRARFILMLSESSLAWEPRGEPGGEKSLLVFKGGAVVRSGHLESGEAPPPPPDCKKPLEQRRAELDLASYDRLRVVATELRRLVSEGRNIELCLGSGAVLHREQLARLLRWF